MDLVRAARQGTGNPAFLAAGQVNGDALEFRSGSDTYRLESAQPLAAGTARPIYVFHASRSNR